MAVKKAKKKAEPFTEKKLLTWLRSAMRSASRRFPPLYEALAAAKEPYYGDNARQKFCYRCADCQLTFSGKEVSIDHIIDCGSLQSWADVQGFMQRLFCTSSGLQVLCSQCHDVKTLMAKSGLTKDEAILRKRVIKLIKDKSAKELLAYLQDKGYSGIAVSNAAKREKIVYEILQGENK